MKNIVLITGGGKRLGSLIAKELSKESFHIVLHYNCLLYTSDAAETVSV